MNDPNILEFSDDCKGSNNELNSSNKREIHYGYFLDHFTLDGISRMALMGLFRRVNRSFKFTERKNFFNNNQVTRILLDIIGKPQYKDQFKALKTSSKAKVIEKFVISCLIPNDLFTYNLDEYEKTLKPLSVGFIDMSKVKEDDHPFTDKMFS